MRRLITGSAAGLAAATLAILFLFAGVAGAQSPSPSPGTGATSTTATTVFTGPPPQTLANTGIETWVLVTGAGVAAAGAVAARRLLGSRA